jgi:two-component system, NarL family, sensor histidine kinase UhpB
VFAPVTVSVPTALSEVAVLLAGFVVALVMYLLLLRRALAPLGRLTRLMRRIDPLAPGQRVDTDAGDEQVMALARAFDEMLDRLERERRESGLRALAAQEAERRRIARELHDEIGHPESADQRHPARHLPGHTATDRTNDPRPTTRPR